MSHTAADLSPCPSATPRTQEAGPPVLVGGPCDAPALAEDDAPAVALVGTAAPAWLPQAAAFRRVVVALDADAAGAGQDWTGALLADDVGLRDYPGERTGR